MAYDFSEERKMTNEELSGELSKLTPLKADEINRLLPRKVDKERLNEILKIVNNSASQNKKLVSLKENFEELGGVVLKLLTKYLI
jgi:hypothetical protein